MVHAIQSDHKITSYRLVKPSKYFKSKRPSQSDRRASKLERYEKEGTGRKDSQKETGNLNDHKAFQSSLKISKPNCIFVVEHWNTFWRLVCSLLSPVLCFFGINNQKELCMAGKERPRFSSKCVNQLSYSTQAVPERVPDASNLHLLLFYLLFTFC